MPIYTSTIKEPFPHESSEKLLLNETKRQIDNQSTTLVITAHGTYC